MTEERNASQLAKEAMEQIGQDRGCQQKVTHVQIQTGAVSANFTFQPVVSAPLSAEEGSWVNLVRERLQMKYSLILE